VRARGKAAAARRAAAAGDDDGDDDTPVASTSRRRGALLKPPPASAAAAATLHLDDEGDDEGDEDFAAAFAFVGHAAGADAMESDNGGHASAGAGASSAPTVYHRGGGTTDELDAVDDGTVRSMKLTVVEKQALYAYTGGMGKVLPWGPQANLGKYALPIFP
jgi:hypothetical protein